MARIKALIERRQRTHVFIGLVIVAGVLVALAVGCAKVEKLTHPDLSVPVAHAAIVDTSATGGAPSAAVTSGCSTCHSEPIAGNCADCHSSVPTSIGGIDFPHHSASGDEAPNDCTICHNASPSDIRFVTKPEANHAYCTACHSLDHS